MDKMNEQYAHFWHCINDLNKAWFILQSIRDNRDNPLCSYAFEFALVTYSKPYKQSKGITKTRHILDKKFVPDKHRDLHDRILKNRDQIHAHTDLSLRDPKVHVENSSYGKIAILCENKINVTAELHNIDSIIELIEQSLDGMYKEEKKLEAALSPDKP